MSNNGIEIMVLVSAMNRSLDELKLEKHLVGEQFKVMFDLKMCSFGCHGYLMQTGIY